jgi:hypothetical protein
MKHIYFPGITRATNDGTPVLSEVAAGEWAIVAEDSSMLATSAFQVDLTGFVAADAATNANEKSKFKLITKLADGNWYSSIAFSLNEIVKYQKIAYNAGTAQVTTITPSLPATQKKGDVYRLKIIDLTAGTANVMRKNYEVVHTGTDFTTTTICDAFRTAIAADADMTGYITGSGTTTLILTAAKDKAFAVATDELMAAFTVALTTKMIPAIGTLAKVQALEQECNAYQYGVWNKVLHPKTAPSYVQASQTTFDIYVLELKKAYNPVDGGKYAGANTIKLYIVETAGATNSFGDLLEAALPTSI